MYCVFNQDRDQSKPVSSLLKLTVKCNPKKKNSLPSCVSVLCCLLSSPRSDGLQSEPPVFGELGAPLRHARRTTRHPTGPLHPGVHSAPVHDASVQGERHGHDGQHPPQLWGLPVRGRHQAHVSLFPLTDPLHCGSIVSFHVQLMILLRFYFFPISAQTCWYVYNMSASTPYFIASCCKYMPYAMHLTEVQWLLERLEHQSPLNSDNLTIDALVTVIRSLFDSYRYSTGSKWWLV